MLNDTPDMSAVQDFLGEAHLLLSRGQECLQHFQQIGEDADASHCLIHTLASLRDRARSVGLLEIADFCAALVALLEPAEYRNRLHGPALGILEACLCLLAWQVELIDPYSGTLNLDAEEQRELLDSLENILRAPVQTA
ncbi:histidine kinase [Pseudomonas sp. GD04058]|uniref:histidine kinase n=1 Tax=Pseudomonas sp. GD04058 TaxID=2975429 RepID=UPI0024490B88|nr:histidine kinase [Pseudomonas sp. GD04058]MDG9884485.1 histidine kinase [Pseudomonas sp. GD04058]